MSIAIFRISVKIYSPVKYSIWIPPFRGNDNWWGEPHPTILSPGAPGPLRSFNPCSSGEGTNKKSPEPPTPDRKAGELTSGVNSSHTECSAQPTFSIPGNNNAQGNHMGLPLTLNSALLFEIQGFLCLPEPSWPLGVLGARVPR